MNKKLEELGEKYLGIAENVCDSVSADIRSLYGRGEKAVMELVDRVTDEKKLRGLGAKVFQHAKGGKKRVQKELRAAYKGYAGYLDSIVKEKPEAVGFWDGFVNAYLATPCERRPRSETYKTHVKYGKAFGWTSSTVLFVTGGTMGKLVGSMPLVVRAVKYLGEKVSEAKATTTTPS